MKIFQHSTAVAVIICSLFDPSSATIRGAAPDASHETQEDTEGVRMLLPTTYRHQQGNKSVKRKEARTLTKNSRKKALINAQRAFGGSRSRGEGSDTPRLASMP